MQDKQQYIDALNYFGIGIRQITKRELDIIYSAYNQKLNPNITDDDRFKDGIEFARMQKYYSLLSDVSIVNGVVDEILNPKPAEEVRPPLLTEEEFHQEFNNEDMKRQYHDLPRKEILDRPTPFSIIFSILFPLYGFLLSIFTWRIAPRSAKWYLFFGIIGFLINFSVYFLSYYLMV